MAQITELTTERKIMEALIAEMTSLVIKNYNEDRRSEAEKLCRQILEKDPNSVQRMNNLGAIVEGDKVFSLFERAILIDPSNTDSYISLGKAYTRQERWEEAIACLESAKREGYKGESNLDSIIVLLCHKIPLGKDQFPVIDASSRLIDANRVVAAEMAMSVS